VAAGPAAAGEAREEGLMTIASVRIILAARIRSRAVGSRVARRRVKPAPCPGKRW